MKQITYFLLGLTSILAFILAGYTMLLAFRDVAVNIDATTHFAIAIISIAYAIVSSIIADKLENNI